MSAPKKRGLGRGLNALMGGGLEPQVNEPAEKSAEKEQAPGEKKTTRPAAAKTSSASKAAPKAPKEDKNGIREIDIALISPDKSQPRKNFDEEALEELAASIKEYGVLQPLLVQKRDDYYQIIAGERRFRAAMKAGLKKLPVVVREYDEVKTLEVALIENIQREDLDPMEEAMAYQRLSEDFGLKQEEIAARVGKSRSAVANSMRLLKLNEELRTLIAEDKISTGHAKVLLGIPDEKLRTALGMKCAAEGWSVRMLEKAAEAAQKAPAEKTGKEDNGLTEQEALAYRIAEENLQKVMGTKVNIVPGKKKGKIEIEYYSEDELERLNLLLLSLKL